MEIQISKQKLTEALLEAFRMGQKKTLAPDYPMRIWAAEKIKEIQNENT